MKNIIVVLLSIFLIYHLVQVDGKTCPSTIKPMTDFEPDKMMGAWYVIEHSRNNISLPVKCLCFTATPIDKTKYIVTSIAITIEGNQPIKTESHVKYVGNPKNGRILARTVYGEDEDIYYANLITDYDTFLFLYGCNPEEQNEHSWLMAREPHPSEDFFEKGHKLIKENGLDLADYKRHSQENCPEL